MNSSYQEPQEKNLEDSVPQHTKFCKHCGEKIDADCVVCPKCGKQVEELKRNQPIVINNTNTNTLTSQQDDGYPYKKKWIAFVLALFLGGLGIHRFYVGKLGTGIIWLLTGGLLFIGWILDVIMILIGAFRDKAGMPLK